MCNFPEQSHPFPQEEVTSQGLALRFYRFSRAQGTLQEVPATHVKPFGVSPLVLMVTLRLPPLKCSEGSGVKGEVCDMNKLFAGGTLRSRNGNKGMILKRQLIHQPFCLLYAQRIDLWHPATGEGYRLLTNFNRQTLTEAAYHTSCAVPKVMTHLQACLMSLRMHLALHSRVKHHLVNTLQHKGNNQLKR